MSVARKAQPAANAKLFPCAIVCPCDERRLITKDACCKKMRRFIILTMDVSRRINLPPEQPVYLDTLEKEMNL
jgi:hypothetical protein